MPPSCHRSIALPQALGLCRTVQGHKSGPGFWVMPRREMLGSWRCWKLWVFMSSWCLEMCWVLSYWRWWIIWISSYYEVSKLAREKMLSKHGSLLPEFMKIYEILSYLLLWHSAKLSLQRASIPRFWLSSARASGVDGEAWPSKTQSMRDTARVPQKTRPRTQELWPGETSKQFRHANQFSEFKKREFLACAHHKSGTIQDLRIPKFPKSSSTAPGWKGADVRERSNILVLAFNWPILFKTWNQFKIYRKPWIFPWNVGMSCKCSIDGKMLAMVWTSISPINLGKDRLSRVFNIIQPSIFGGITSKTCSNRKGRIFGWFQDFRESVSKRPPICKTQLESRSELGNRCGLMPARRCHPRWRSPHSIQCWSWRAAPVTLLFWKPWWLGDLRDLPFQETLRM